MSTAVSSVTLHIDTAGKSAIAPSGGQISVISRASDCRFGGSREPSEFCNRLLRGGESRNRSRSLPSDDVSSRGIRDVRTCSHSDARSCGRPRAASIQGPVHELAVHVLGRASSGSVGLEIDGGSSVSPPSFRSDTRSGRQGGCHGGSLGESLRRWGVIDRALAGLPDVSATGT